MQTFEDKLIRCKMVRDVGKSDTYKYSSYVANSAVIKG